MDVVNIYSQSEDVRAQRLSNFTARRFTFGGVECSSIESVLQAFKAPDMRVQEVLCRKTAEQAHRAKGGLDRVWQRAQLLHWQGATYKRSSAQYQTLIATLYDTVYEQDVSFRRDILAAAGATLMHEIGKYDQRETVLTNPEFLGQLHRLQVRALLER